MGWGLQTRVRVWGEVSETYWATGSERRSLGPELDSLSAERMVQGSQDFVLVVSMALHLVFHLGEMTDVYSGVH